MEPVWLTWFMHNYCEVGREYAWHAAPFIQCIVGKNIGINTAGSSELLNCICSLNKCNTLPVIITTPGWGTFAEVWKKCVTLEHPMQAQQEHCGICTG